MVISPSGTVKYEDAGPAQGSRAAGRAPGSGDRGAGGVYAMAPGPDGVLRYQYFPSDPEAGSPPARRASGRDDRGAAGGFYAKVPGPDGVMRYQYFPSRPPR